VRDRESTCASRNYDWCVCERENLDVGLDIRTISVGGGYD